MEQGAMLSDLFTWRSAIASSESGLTSTQRHVALTLSLHMSEKGDSCFPSMPRLVDETGLGLSTIREALRKLDEAGWLVREVSHRRGKTNRYTAQVPDAYRQQPAVSLTASKRRSNRQHLAAIPPAPGGEDVKESDSEDDSSSTRADAPVAAAAALLDAQLADLGVTDPVRSQALAEPERAKEWLELAATEATTNPAGYFVAGFTSGGRPSRRIGERQTSDGARREWIERTSWQLAAEDAHALVDDWRDLDDVERGELHELVDRIRSTRAESEAA